MTFFKTIPLLIGFLLVFGFTNPERDTIYWDANRKLTWKDFKEVNRSGTTGAVSSIGIEYKLNVEGNVADVTIRCFFNRKDSWVKRGQKHDKGLNHEQGHFDISEIIARRFRKHLTTRDFNDATIDNEVSAIYRQYVKELGHYQDLYDQETDHHREELKQDVWDLRIKRELKQLENYSSTKLKVRMSS